MKWLDPLHWISLEQYNLALHCLTTYIFGGVGARIISAFLLIATTWFILRRKNLAMGLLFMGFCVAVVFGQWIHWIISYI